MASDGKAVGLGRTVLGRDEDHERVGANAQVETPGSAAGTEQRAIYHKNCGRVADRRGNGEAHDVVGDAGDIGERVGAKARTEAAATERQTA